MSRSTTYYHLPVLAYAVIIFAGSSIPNPPATIMFSMRDKFLHLLEYSIFGLLLARSAFLWRRSWQPKMSITAALIVGATYAASDEFHQSFVPGRDCNWLDWAADLCGLAVGIVVYYIVFAKGKVLKSNSQTGS